MDSKVLWAKCRIAGHGLGALLAATLTVGCDDLRSRVHEFTRPDADTIPAPAASIRAEPSQKPSAAVPAAPSANAADAGPRDAGPSKTDAGPKATGAQASPPAPKRAPEPLNGFPAGARCVDGTPGNSGCASGSECTGGKCTCYNGWTSCGGACRDLSRDPDNCNACGRQCTFGQRCKWGSCE